MLLWAFRFFVRIVDESENRLTDVEIVLDTILFAVL